MKDILTAPFVEEMKNGMVKAFPQFRENTYYQRYAEEEHKNIQ